MVVERDLPADQPSIWGDPDQVVQVIMNLLINAQQALQQAPEPRRLRIGAGYEPEAGMIRLVVDDNGPGVPMAIRSRIFEPFFTTKPVGFGTGVGLSVCHAIVTSHGGTIAVDDAPGGGARFIVRLPVGGAEADVPVEPATARGGSAPPHAGGR